MSTYMEELTEAWVGWLRQRDAVKHKVIELIRRTNASFEDDEDDRSRELKKLQREFYRVAIAEILRSQGNEAKSPDSLLLMADNLLEKRGYKFVERGQPSDMRNADEERAYGTVRVRWSHLLKAAKVDTPDNRGGPNRW